jgi:hypothetical protein
VYVKLDLMMHVTIAASQSQIARRRDVHVTAANLY